jgi:hypothetical protein
VVDRQPSPLFWGLSSLCFCKRLAIPHGCGHGQLCAVRTKYSLPVCNQLVTAISVPSWNRLLPGSGMHTPIPFDTCTHLSPCLTPAHTCPLPDTGTPFFTVRREPEPYRLSWVPWHFTPSYVLLFSCNSSK